MPEMFFYIRRHFLRLWKVWKVCGKVCGNCVEKWRNVQLRSYTNICTDYNYNYYYYYDSYSKNSEDFSKF